jgi:hypothetical protein
MADPTGGGCSHDPRTREERAIEMYHCPDCGMLVRAGVPHPPVVQRPDGSWDYDVDFSETTMSEQFFTPDDARDTLENLGIYF